MSSSSRSHSRIAHVEDAEEDSGSSINGIEGTRKYAMSEAPMPPKIQPNTGKSRSDRRPANSRSSANVSFDEPGSYGYPSEKRGMPPARRSSRRESGDTELRSHDRERRRKDRNAREDEEDRQAAAAAAAAAARSRSKANDPDSRPLRKQRPTSLKQSATQPVIQQLYRRGHVDDPASYGIKQPAVSGNRPRAQTRPASYYAGQPVRPAPLNMPWYPPPHPPPQFAVGTFPPPPTWQGPGTSPGGFSGPPPPSPMGPGPGYFDGGATPQNPHSHLRHRFGFDARPSSAMAYRKQPPPPPPPALDYYNHEDFIDEPSAMPRPTRRPSRSIRAEDDRKRMPPPEHIPLRAQSALPPTTPYRPPPPQLQRPPSRQNQSRPPPTNRRSVGFADQACYDDEDFLGDDDLFHDISPNASFDQRHAVVPRSRRSSVAYDHQDYDLVPATSRGRRPSTYGSALPSGGVSLEDDKYTDALKYQEAISGGSQMPLTAESLRKASKRGAVASSRSTRSSGSRDDSEYKRSNATGITRTSFNSDDFTIKVSGGARVRVPGAEIECEDGGEITFSTRPTGPRSSDKASMMYPQIEDSRSRFEHRALTHRTRAPSQSDSQSRGYAPSHVDYDFPGGYF